MDELSGAHSALLLLIERRMAARLELKGEGAAFRAELTARAQQVVGLAVDLRLKAFLGRALEARALHLEWLEGIAMVVGNRPPSEWTDSEIARFDVGLEEIRALFLRAEDLARVGMSVTGRAELQRPIELRPDEVVAVEGAEREILKLLEGRLGAQRHIWLAALGRTLNSLLEPSNHAVPLVIDARDTGERDDIG